MRSLKTGAVVQGLADVVCREAVFKVGKDLVRYLHCGLCTHVILARSALVGMLQGWSRV